jgi:hypothetical protein
MKELAMNLAIATLMEDIVKEHRQNLRDQMVAELREIGADSVKVKFGEEGIGKVSLVEPKSKPFIQNETAFLNWVISSHPTEVVQMVRESFKDHVLKNVTFTDDGTAILDSGEIVEGVSHRPSSGYVSMRFEKTGRRSLTEKLSVGTLTFNPPMQIGEAEND